MRRNRIWWFLRNPDPLCTQTNALYHTRRKHFSTRSRIYWKNNGSLRTRIGRQRCFSISKRHQSPPKLVHQSRADPNPHRPLSSMRPSTQNWHRIFSVLQLRRRDRKVEHFLLHCPMFSTQRKVISSSPSSLGLSFPPSISSFPKHQIRWQSLRILSPFQNALLYQRKPSIEQDMSLNCFSLLFSQLLLSPLAFPINAFSF